MPLTEAAIRLFATDIDDFVRDDDAAPPRFRDAWESLEPDRRPLLVYNSGRSVADVSWLVLEKHLPTPEFIIGGIGTEVHDPVDSHAAEEFEATLSRTWNRARVLEVVNAIAGAQLQPAENLTDHKLSWHWPCATSADLFRVEYRLREVGLDVTVNYSSGVFLDVLPRGAGKGDALAWLCRRIGVPLERVLVAGSSGNNASMFRLPGIRGILPGNVSRDLLAKVGRGDFFMTAEKAGAGILAGLAHFCVLPGVADPAGALLGVAH